jgi:hypothetical protein
MKSHPHKRPPSEHISNPLMEESLRKRPYPHIGHQKEFKDGMSSDAIEGAKSFRSQSYLLSFHTYTRCLI